MRSHAPTKRVEVLLPLWRYSYMKLILASGSPRRAELLQKMGLSFTVQPSNTEEVLVRWKRKRWCFPPIPL